jgi:DNA polymerase-3 subunit gamma/tau
VRVVALAPGELTFAVAPGYSGDPTPEIRDALLRATGTRWQVSRAEGDAAPSLREAAEAAREAQRAALLAHPLVDATMAAFPGAELVDESADARVVAQASKWRN